MLSTGEVYNNNLDTEAAERTKTKKLESAKNLLKSSQDNVASISKKSKNAKPVKTSATNRPTREKSPILSPQDTILIEQKKKNCTQKSISDVIYGALPFDLNFCT